MSTKVIKLQDNENNVLLPVTDAKLVQMKVENETKSVQDVIIENELITARALTDLNDTKQDVIDDLDEIRAGAALGVTALQTETQLSKGTTAGSGNAVTDISVNNHQITLTKGATFLTEHQDLSSYADGAEYDSTNHYIYLKHGNTRLSNPINASDFIKDGMVDTVEVTEGNLVITFNTDSGKEDIEIPLSDIFDPSLYYTKEEIDEHELVTARSLTELHDTKQELLTFDSTPTANSQNPVTSEGIKEYVDDAIDASTPMTEITYSDLVTARNNNNLKPGSYYRITDYNCTTTQENTRSAGHQFDIVLLALSENKLAEEGWAMMHDNIYDVTFGDGVTKKCWLYLARVDTSGNQLINVVDTESRLGIPNAALEEFTINESGKTAFTEDWTSAELGEENLPYNYFQNSNLSAWKVWYCLDNDKDRFAWAQGEEVIPDTLVVTLNDNTEVSCTRRSGTKTINEVIYYRWKVPEGIATIDYLTEKEFPTEGDIFYRHNNTSSVPLPPTAIGTVSSFIPEHIEEGDGRGVIYRLIDEWDNDVPYDFKNIMFTDDVAYYTFNVANANNPIDASLSSATSNNKISTIFDSGINVLRAIPVVVFVIQPGYSICSNIVENGMRLAIILGQGNILRNMFRICMDTNMVLSEENLIETIFLNCSGFSLQTLPTSPIYINNTPVVINS